MNATGGRIIQTPVLRVLAKSRMGRIPGNEIHPLVGTLRSGQLKARGSFAETCMRRDLLRQTDVLAIAIEPVERRILFSGGIAAFDANHFYRPSSDIST